MKDFVLGVGVHQPTSKDWKCNWYQRTLRMLRHDYGITEGASCIQRIQELHEMKRLLVMAQTN